MTPEQKLRDLEQSINAIQNALSNLKNEIDALSNLKNEIDALSNLKNEILDIRKEIQSLKLVQGNTTNMQKENINPRLKDEFYQLRSYKTIEKDTAITDNQLIAMITSYLNEINTPPNLKGFSYLREAILRVCKDFSCLQNMSLYLYPPIAHEYNDKPKNVERCIRTAIEVTWNKISRETVIKFFGDTSLETPTNKKFIVMLVDYLRFQLSL